MLAIQSNIAKYHCLFIQRVVAFQMPGVFFDSPGIQFGYINRISYHLIDIFVIMINFKCSMLQEQNERLYCGKKLQNKFCENISGLKVLEVMP